MDSKQRHEIKKSVLEKLALTDGQLDLVKKRMQESMAKGLSGDKKSVSSLKMLPTYVRDTPDGTEVGDFLALDLGGTNFRVLRVRISEDEEGGKIHMDNQVYKMPPEVMTGTGEELFDYIAESIGNFLEVYNLKDVKLPLGFTFSFPCQQDGLDKGTLLRWTKGFSASGVVGENVVDLLQDAVNRMEEKYELEIVALVNDTVGTMMSCGHEDHDCVIGMIVGTGTNACYMENVANVETLPEQEKGDGKGQMCINTEWGAFGEFGELEDIVTEYDRIVDQRSINPGCMLYEKMISGMYMGEVVRNVVVDLIEKKVLFGGVLTKKMATFGEFETAFVTQIECDHSHKLRMVGQVLRHLGYDTADIHFPEEEDGAVFSGKCTLEDRQTIREICEVVSTRSAYLCASGVAALLERIIANGQLKGNLTVGVDGTVYKKHPHFRRLLESKVRDLVADGTQITFRMSHDGSGKGAALVTAVACRIAGVTPEQMIARERTGDSEGESDEITHEQVIKSAIKKMDLTEEQLQTVKNRMAAALTKGLSKQHAEESSLSMLPTYVKDTPDGSEVGDFLALDLGGTNFRVLRVKISEGEDGSKIHIDNQVYRMPQEVMTGTGEELFDYIAESIGNFLEMYNLKDVRLPLGFTFSFPCQQDGLDKGKLLRWTKGFSAAGVVGRNVVEMLQEAVDRMEEKYQLEIVALVNDTVGTLMSCGHEDHDCVIGLIVGTGTNACYMENIENVENLKEEERGEGQMCINTEWGAFGERGELEDVITEYDRAVDQRSINPGCMLYEKMISGMYMGEVVRNIVVDLAKAGALFSGKITEKLDKFGEFETSFISQIENDHSHTLRMVAQTLRHLGYDAEDIDFPDDGVPFAGKCNLHDRQVLREICESVSTRSAHLCASGVAALLERVIKNKELLGCTHEQAKNLTVGVDGTVYKKHPHFRRLLESKVRDLLPADTKLTFRMSHDGSGKGAALVTAVACRIAGLTPDQMIAIET